MECKAKTGEEGEEVDLENKLLEALSIYHPPLGSWSTVRHDASRLRPDPADPMHKLIDQACERFLMLAVFDTVPENDEQDAAMIAQLDRREEILEHLRHVPEYEMQLEDGTGLMYAIFAWTAAQSFTRWGNIPWRRLVATLLDPDPSDSFAPPL